MVSPTAGAASRYMLIPSTKRPRTTWRSSSEVEQGTHKPLVGGSNPPSATRPAPIGPQPWWPGAPGLPGGTDVRLVVMSSIWVVRGAGL